MVKKGKIRVCITLDESVYKKLCNILEFYDSLSPYCQYTKSEYINKLLDEFINIPLVNK